MLFLLRGNPMECRDISDHDFEFFKKNKKDPGELPVYKCKKCGMTWEEMVEIREVQDRLDGVEANSEVNPEASKSIEDGFKRIFGFE
jgi:uncharacterized Zn finger protein